MDAVVGTGAEVEAHVFGVLEGAEGGLELGDVAGLPEVGFLTGGGGGALADEDAAALGDGGAGGGLVEASEVGGGEEEPGEARVGGEGGHGAACGRDAVVGVEGVEAVEEGAGAVEGGGLGCLEPVDGERESVAAVLRARRASESSRRWTSGTVWGSRRV